MSNIFYIRGVTQVTHSERYAALSLLATLAVGAFIVMRFMDGWSVPDQSGGLLLKTYVMAVAASVVAESVIAGVLARRRTGVDQDERDLAIRRRADQAAWVFAAVALNVLIVQVLMEAAYAGHALPRIDLTSAAAVVFVLLLVLYGATAVQRASTLVLYRLPGA